MEKIDFNKKWVVTRLDNPEDTKVVDVPYDAMFYEERKPDAPSGKNCCWVDCHDYSFIKEFELTEDQINDHDLILEFESVYHNAEVYLNDEKIASRPYGYTNFYVDLTDKVKVGNNVLKVIAYNSDQPNQRWYSGCGLIRPVWLYVLPKKHILINGIRITTLDYESRKIKVEIKTNGCEKAKVQILDGSNIKAESNIDLNNGNGELEFEVTNSKLWDLDNPYLYTAHIETETDSQDIKFGIRQIKLDGNGFFLNGIRTIMSGCCVHSDNQLIGCITNPFVEERRVRILKDVGYNAIRCAHNPCSKDFLNACDKLGMIVMDEYVDCWYIHKTRHDYVSYLKDWWKEDLKDMVEKDYNHPSVMIYSIGNEVSETAKKKGVEYAKMLTDELHSLDSTRYVTAGVNILFNYMARLGFGFYNDKKAEQEEKKNKKKKKAVGSEFFNNVVNFFGGRFLRAGARLHGCDKATKDAFAVMDMAGYNYGIARYKHDLKKYPNRIIVGSETFCADEREFYKMAKENPRIVGDFVWAGMDYLGEVGVGSWVPKDHCDGIMDGSCGWMTAGSGRVDFIGDETCEALYTKVALEKTPIEIGVVPHKYLKMKHSVSSWKMSMALHSWSFEGEEEKTCRVEVYSIGETVQLFLNQKKIKQAKTKKNGRNIFKVKYQPGELKAVSLDSDGNKLGEVILKSASKENALTIKPESNEISKDELAFVRLSFTDTNEEIKPLNEGEIKVEVEGGKLISFGSANPYCKEGYHNDTSKTNYGVTMAVIKPNGDSNIVIKASGLGLESTKTIEVK